MLLLTFLQHLYFGRSTRSAGFFLVYKCFDAHSLELLGLLGFLAFRAIRAVRVIKVIRIIRAQGYLIIYIGLRNLIINGGF